MTNNEKIIELAKMDGLTVWDSSKQSICNGCAIGGKNNSTWLDVPMIVIGTHKSIFHTSKGKMIQDVEKPKPYLTSYDVIMTLIRKQKNKTQVEIGVILEELVCQDSGCDPELVTIIMVVLATPEQLADALLRATGKWKE